MVRQAVKSQTVISIFTTFPFLLNLCLEKNGMLKMLVIFVPLRASFKNFRFYDVRNETLELREAILSPNHVFITLSGC